MIKEELEKEAEDFLQKKWGTSEMLILGGDARKVLADFAEPREKRIEELEKENAELKEELKTAYRKGMRHMAKALKDYDRTDGAWTDYFEHTVDKVLQREQLEFEEYGTLADQLTKSKELLKRWVELYKPKLEGYPITPIQEQTEQFLNSEVEK